MLGPIAGLFRVLSNLEISGHRCFGLEGEPMLDRGAAGSGKRPPSSKSSPRSRKGPPAAPRHRADRRMAAAARSPAGIEFAFPSTH
jgi:hypothetical protein